MPSIAQDSPVANYLTAPSYSLSSAPPETEQPAAWVTELSTKLARQALEAGNNVRTANLLLLGGGVMLTAFLVYPSLAEFKQKIQRFMEYEKARSGFSH